MSLWRIQIALSGDPQSLELFAQALAAQPASPVRLAPCDAGTGADIAGMTGEVVVELAHDEGLATMLGTLQGISPRIFVRRAKPGEMACPLPQSSAVLRDLSGTRRPWPCSGGVPRPRPYSGGCSAAPATFAPD
jgi:hypothetical protein